MTETEIRTIFEVLDQADTAVKALREKFTSVLMREGDGRDFLVKSCQSKRSYKTPEAAGNAAASAKEKSGDTLRVYGCPLCQGFHLTKGDLEEFARRAG
jgi:hypothetical protein